MNFNADDLIRLLPAIYRIRDVEQARGNLQILTPAERAELANLESESELSIEKQKRLRILVEKRDRGALKCLMEVLAEPLAVVQDNLEQLYDDQFIETCADWVVPYIGDLIGCRAIKPVGTGRAEVAHTMAYRRRKGTLAVLEQLATDVTGLKAHAVEYFQFLATTQYMNHIRKENIYSPDFRKGNILDDIGTPFDSIPHTVDVRSVTSNSGRFNIQNIGIFLWRLNAYSLTNSPAVPVKVRDNEFDTRRYRLSPLGIDAQIFTKGESEDELTHISEPRNVPLRLSRRTLQKDLTADRRNYYGENLSFELRIDDKLIRPEDVIVSNLRDCGTTWENLPPDGKVAIDPELGRLALSANWTFPSRVTAKFHYGFSSELGGGEYPRNDSFDSIADTNLIIRTVPSDKYPSIQRALDSLNGSGIVEIIDSGRYEEDLSVEIATDQKIEIRAKNGRRPTVVLNRELHITGEERSSFVINGILLLGNPLYVPFSPSNKLSRLEIKHSTLVPGRCLDTQGEPIYPGVPSIIVESENVTVTLKRTITGSIRLPASGQLFASDSIIDACDVSNLAYCGLERDNSAHDIADPAGGKISLDCCTIIGRLHATQVETINNSIILVDRNLVDQVVIEHKQTGCVRFSYLPLNSRVPRRYRCCPDPSDSSDALTTPNFLSTRYGRAEYCRLSSSTPDSIWTGADDESEMGVFHHLFEPLRNNNLRLRLNEYLRVGLEAGIFYVI
jgi:hypothetical protein